MHLYAKGGIRYGNQNRTNQAAHAGNAAPLPPQTPGQNGAAAAVCGGCAAGVRGRGDRAVRRQPPARQREPQPVAAPADTPAQAEPTAQPAAPGQYVVAIDPGHGGINPNIGAEDWGSEADGVRESDVTLCTAQLLYEKLAADDRFAPLLTADGSTYLKPSERAAAAKAAGADLLLSIHLNSDASAATNGLECYAAPPALAANAESVRFGRLVTAAFRDQLGLTLRGWDGVRYLYFDANNARVVAESSDTTVRSDPTFTVLEDCGCPAVLVEEGFITNASDRAALCTDSACEQAAELYYQCIIDFFE